MVAEAAQLTLLLDDISAEGCALLAAVDVPWIAGDELKLRITGERDLDLELPAQVVYVRRSVG